MVQKRPRHMEGLDVHTTAWISRAWSRWAPSGQPWRGSASHSSLVNERDRDLLYSAVSFSASVPDHLRTLMRFLAEARAVRPEQIPADLVTMNSIVRLRQSDGGAPLAVELVYPFDADTKPLARSITAPLGAALFGRRIGDSITWTTPAGPASATVDALEYQPEREGDYHR